jgi:hypothetical protein
MVTILSSNGTASVEGARADASGLWIPAPELAKLGWELRPEGVCRADDCVPIPRGSERGLLRDDAGERLFNLSEFAALRRQPLAPT